MRRFSLLLAAVALSACAAGPDPYCSNIVDLTGTPAALCLSPRQVPVCDNTGDMARFEPGPRGFTLVGGTQARCTAATFTIDCPSGMPPRCIMDPEL